MVAATRTSVIGADEMRPIPDSHARPAGGAPASEDGQHRRAGADSPRRDDPADGAGSPPAAAVVLFTLGGTISMAGPTAAALSPG